MNFNYHFSYITVSTGKYLLFNHHLEICTFLDLIPINKEKYKDLMVLKQFCGPSAVKYFTELPHEQ